MIRELEAVWALTWRDLLRFRRDGTQLLGTLARPLLWLVLLGNGMRAAVPSVRGVEYRHFVFAGAIAMALLFSGTFQSVTIIFDREFGFLKEVLVAPVSRVTIVVGKILSGAAVAVLQGIVTIAFAPVVGVRFGPGAAGALLGVVVLLALAVTALGVALASRMRTFEGFGVISNFVVLPLYFLSGGPFPIDGLPPWMSALVHLNPVTYGVDLMRIALGQPATFAASTDLGVLLLFGAGAVGLSLLLFRRA
jgi:ABC-2 type transport system permease protein